MLKLNADEDIASRRIILYRHFLFQNTMLLHSLEQKSHTLPRVNGGHISRSSIYQKAINTTPRLFQTISNIYWRLDWNKADENVILV